MKNKIWLSSPHMGGQEIEFINNAFQDNWVAPLGPNVDGFEHDIENFAKIKSAAALSSGTAAIHLALILLNVGLNDEVLCSTFTFSATANPILYQGATPIFVESESLTWNMCPNALEEAIKDRLNKGKRPKAIIIVHLYGQPAQIDQLIDVANRYEIPLIEDAAESLGSTFENQMTGTFGHLGIFSFNGNKIITTSGGGALVSNDDSLIQKARFLSTQARDPAPHYQHSQIGYNYRMSNIVAGIGRGQMLVINDRIRQRRSVFKYYREKLGTISEINFLEELPNTFSNKWLTTITIKSNQIDREEIRLKLLEENIEARPLWKPMHQQPIFESYPYYGNRLSEELFSIGLCLPSGSNLSQDDLDRVCNTISKTFKK